ncbi:hypothetical protein AX15_001282 [Amanita polypyramis BW_CC]|nr:hypothetical protein AX15_001282 [Amanita polypyramis BW_CC]
MPHKRAKRSAREELQWRREVDLPPEKDSLSSEAIPKSASRILDATKIREEWKSKKRQLEPNSNPQGSKRRRVNGGDERDNSDSRKSSGSIQWKIQHGESIQQFNRRVEDGMRPIVGSAIQGSRATVRQAFKEARQLANTVKSNAAKPSPRSLQADSGQSKRFASPAANMVVMNTKVSTQSKDFEKVSTSLPRRLNDIAQAPPALTALPRGARKLQQRFAVPKNEGVLSMAQKSMIDREREKVIQKYRLLRANRRNLHVTGEGAGIVPGVVAE